MCVCAKKQKEVARTLFCFGVVWLFFGGAGGGGEEVGASVFFGFGRKQREGALVVYLLLCVEGDDAERHALRPSYLSGKERWREVERAPPPLCVLRPFFSSLFPQLFSIMLPCGSSRNCSHKTRRKKGLCSCSKGSTTTRSTRP